MARCVTRNALVRFVANTWCHNSNEQSSSRLRVTGEPALLTRMSSRPVNATNRLPLVNISRFVYIEPSVGLSPISGRRRRISRGREHAGTNLGERRLRMDALAFVLVDLQHFAPLDREGRYG